MKKMLLLTIFFILAMQSCRERNNMFDIGSDNFVYPPSIYAWPSGAWYDYDGNLVGVRIQVEFYNECESVVTLTHVLYMDDTRLKSVEYTEMGGGQGYYVDIFQELLVGYYSVRLYFAEIPIESCQFRVVPGQNRLTIEHNPSHPVRELQYLPMFEDCTN